MAGSSGAATQPIGALQAEDQAIAKAVEGKLLLRVVPILFLLYAAFSVDRGNLGMAALEMNPALGISAEMYGLGAGIFTFAYLIFQYPNALLLRRLGGPRGLAAVSLFWAVASMGTAFAQNASGFLFFRFLLGMGEAGFNAFLMFYVSTVFPRRMRGLTVALTLVAVPLSMVVLSPVSAVLLDLEFGGLQGWQWLFVLEGAPSLALAVACWLLLPEAASSARFLSQAERTWLVAEVADTPTTQQRTVKVDGIGAQLSNGVVWLLGAVLFGTVLGTNLLLFWMPQILKLVSNTSNMQTGLLNAATWAVFGTGMLVFGRISDRLTNRVPVLMAALLTAALGFVLGAFAASPWLAFAGMLLGALGIGAAQGLFWTIPMQLISGAGATGAFAIITIIGNSSGLFAHSFIGWLRDRSGSFSGALLSLSGVLLVACALLLALSLLVRRKTV